MPNTTKKKNEPKRVLTENEVNQRRKAGFQKGQKANATGKGGFGDNPQNQRKAVIARRERANNNDWFNSYKASLWFFSKMDMNALMYLASKFGITDTPVELTDEIRAELREHFGSSHGCKTLPSLADSTIRMILESKTDTKLYMKIVEQLEGKATVRTENLNANMDVNDAAFEKLRKENQELQKMLNRLTGVSVTASIEQNSNVTNIKPINVIKEADFVEVQSQEAKPLE